MLNPPVTELVFTLLTTHQVLEADRRLTRSETRSALLQQQWWTHTRLARQVSRAPACTGTWQASSPRKGKHPHGGRTGILCDRSSTAALCTSESSAESRAAAVQAPLPRGSKIKASGASAHRTCRDLSGLGRISL